MPIAELITSEADRLGCPVSPDRAERLSRFVALLSHWSGRIRLTGSPDPSELVTRHLVDALVLAALLPRAEGYQRCVDVGAGGGLPGIPCALLRSDLSLTLVESNGRKCAFIRTAAFALGLDCRVEQTRVEQLKADPHDLAWSRATFAPPVWLSCAAGLLRHDGLAAVFTARRLSAPTPGFELAQERAYALADGTPRVLSLLRLAIVSQETREDS